MLMTCSVGCWWQWDPPKHSAPQDWTMVIHGSEPCVGFQVMHHASDRQLQADVTNTAVKLLNVFDQEKKNLGPPLAASADPKTWLVRARMNKSLRLWLSGDTHVRATIQVRDHRLTTPTTLVSKRPQTNNTHNIGTHYNTAHNKKIDHDYNGTHSKNGSK